MREFAAAHADEESGPEAYFVLGYTAFSEKDYANAAEFLRLAARVHTPLSDYAEFYLAAARQNGGDHAGAVPVLTGFDSRNPDSFLIARATMALATGLLATDKPRQAAELLAARIQTLPHPAADLLLGNAWEAAGDSAKALAAFAEIYYQHPASAEAAEAAKHKEHFSKPSVDLLVQRADALLDAGTRGPTRADRMRYLASAQGAYRELAAASKGAVSEHAQVRLGRVFYQLGQTAGARTALAALKPSDPDADAERLYYLGESNRRLKREGDFMDQVKTLAQRYPKSNWYEEALFSAANYTLVTHNAEQAAPLYGRLAELFPNGKYAAQSGWKLAWAKYREGAQREARSLMEAAARAGDSALVPGALYWAARMSETTEAAAQWLRALVEGYPLTFYGLAARRLPGFTPWQHTPKNAPPNLEPTADSAPRRLKLLIFRQVGLLDLAASEAKQAALNDPRNQPYWALEWAGAEYQRGRYNVSIAAARQAVPNSPQLEIEQLPRRFWDAFFPLPWWETLKRESAEQGMDPYLMAGIIRQESAFNERAVSRANARGLMQILPSTGRKLARTLGLRNYGLPSLFDPHVNIKMGVVYFKQLLAEHNGVVEDTLAAYNAGPDRVEAWRATTYKDNLEFVESIPFTETRDYVKIVLRNAEIYRRLYP